MNISPFCKLEGRINPNAWAKDVNDVYDAWSGGEEDGSQLSYLPDKEASYRESYPSQNMKDGELLATRTKVASINSYFIPKQFIFRLKKNTTPLKETLRLSIYFMEQQQLSVKNNLGINSAKYRANLDWLFEVICDLHF